jgi:hypothetical protein
MFQTRADVIGVQASILEEISHLGADLGEMCVRRSHALTLAARGLSGVKDLTALRDRVLALEAQELGPCEHAGCLAEAAMRRRDGPPSSALMAYKG